MAASRYNYICIKDTGEVEYIASQSIGDILYEFGDDFSSIIRQDLHSSWDDDKYKLTEWHD